MAQNLDVDKYEGNKIEPQQYFERQRKANHLNIEKRY
jgi:hypothetical protein